MIIKKFQNILSNVTVIMTSCHAAFFKARKGTLRKKQGTGDHSLLPGTIQPKRRSRIKTEGQFRHVRTQEFVFSGALLKDNCL